MTLGIQTSNNVAADPHEAHVNRILDQFNADLRAKYEAGQSEHGGELWNKRGLLDHAIEEAIDMVVYLYTLREQLARGMKP
jgi:hypothetical protein